MKEHSGQADRRRTGKRIDRQPPVPLSEGHVQCKSIPSPAEASPGAVTQKSAVCRNSAIASGQCNFSASTQKQAPS